MNYKAEWILLLILSFFVISASASGNISSQGLIISKSVHAGGSITIIESLKNTGDDGSEPAVIMYYLVNRSMGSAEPVQIGSADLESLDSGRDYTSVNTFLLPLNLAEGAYQFVRKVMGKSGPSQQKSEWIADYPVTVTSETGGPHNVTPVGVIVPKESVPGKPLKVTYAVDNQGNTDSNLMAVHLYLTNQTNMTPIHLGSWNLTSVPAKGENISTQYVNIPDSVPLGVYGLLLDIDPNKISGEDHRNNRWQEDRIITITNNSEGFTFPLGNIQSSSSVVVVSDPYWSRNQSR